MAILKPPIPKGWGLNIEHGQYVARMDDGAIISVPQEQVEDYGMGELVKAREKYASAYLLPKKGSGRVKHIVEEDYSDLASKMTYALRESMKKTWDEAYSKETTKWKEVFTSGSYPPTPLTKDSCTTAVAAMYEERNPFIDQVIEMEYVGSRVTCNPAPTDTDEDILLLVDDLEEVIVRCTNQGYVGGETYFDSGAITKLPDFCSLRKGDMNLIVTSNKLFYDKFLLATSVCKKLNLLKKNDRITVFQAILYEKGPK